MSTVKRSVLVVALAAFCTAELSLHAQQRPEPAGVQNNMRFSSTSQSALAFSSDSSSRPLVMHGDDPADNARGNRGAVIGGIIGGLGMILHTQLIAMSVGDRLDAKMALIGAGLGITLGMPIGVLAAKHTGNNDRADSR